MKALLVYPEWPDTYWSFKHALPFEGKRSLYPPLGLMTVASLLPAHWNKRLVDTNIRALAEADLRWADVAMLSGMLIHKPELLGPLDRCRKRGLRTVIGGPVTSSVAELPQHADHVVKGEAEELIADLAADLERGTPKPLYQAAERPGLHLTPMPDVSLINLKHYSAMAIQFSRGCPFNCEFCDIIEIYGGKPRTNPRSGIAELEQLRERKWRGPVFIVDDNFIGNKKMVKEMLPALADWNNAQSSLHFLHRGLDESVRRSGTPANDEGRALHPGLSGHRNPGGRELEAGSEGQNTRRGLLDSVKRIQSYGMEVMAGFIVGFDNDPEEIFDKQVEFIQESAIPLAMVGLLMALPGTQLYRRLLKEGRIVCDGNGNNLDFRLNFHAAHGPAAPARRLSLDPAAHLSARYLLRARAQIPGAIPATHALPAADALADCQALARSILRQGIFSRYAFSYWRLFHRGQHALPAIVRRRRSAWRSWVHSI